MTAEVQSRPFLRQVADHYLNKGLDGRIFVFPNKRSIAFFKKYIADALKEKGASPVLAPRMMGISEFFAAMAHRKTADHITLILKLYECYSRIVKEGESLDDFLYWGDTLLSDFGDIDKYQIDAKAIFSNILDLKLMDGDLSFLTDAQKDAIRRLSGYFVPEKWVHDPNNAKDVKARFLNVWTHMFEIYTEFRKVLTDDGMAYDGMVYRELAEFLKTGSASTLLSTVFPDTSCCVFIGLNTLNTCENDVLAALQKENLAEFCWDFSGSMLTDDLNQASHFMKINTSKFPNGDFKLDPQGLPKPDIHIVGVPSASAQAKVVHEIISKVDEKERGLDFALVLPDESMLAPVLSSLPQLEAVNVTMGYPLATSEWNALMRSIIALQFHAKDSKWFYHVQVKEIFTNAITKGVFGEVENTCVAEVQKGAKAYVPVTDLAKSDLFSLIFKPVVGDMTLASAEQVKALASYLCDVVEAVAGRLDADSDALHLECAYRYLQCVKRLAGTELQILPKTFVRLLEQLVARINVPFSGEPLGGLQIMGPLETRCLDFKHLVILNANEGVFPGRNSSSSIIPPELRVAFGLPTYELQDNIWAYYFYRMISRAQDVWMLYDSRTEGLTTGEESRYIKQLEYNYSVPVRRSIAASSPGSPAVSGDIAKTSEDVETLLSRPLSASAIKSYLHCPAQFYYSFVKGLKAEEEVAESMDNAMTGNVFHKVMELLYTTVDHRVTAPFIQSCLDNPAQIQEMVNRQVMEQMHSTQIKGRDLVVSRLLCKYVLKTLEWDLKSLQDNGMDAFEICGLELPLDCRFGRFRLKGIIDRLDSFRPGELRVVDYKTGKVVDKDTGITDANASETAELIFRKEVVDRPEIALQFFVYDYLLRNTGDKRVLQATCRYDKLAGSVYSTRKIMSSQPVTDAVSERFYDEMTARLGDLLEEIANIDLPFSRTPHRKKCEWCDFKNLCGR